MILVINHGQSNAAQKCDLGSFNNFSNAMRGPTSFFFWLFIGFFFAFAFTRFFLPELIWKHPNILWFLLFSGSLLAFLLSINDLCNVDFILRQILDIVLLCKFPIVSLFKLRYSNKIFLYPTLLRLANIIKSVRWIFPKALFLDWKQLFYLKKIVCQKAHQLFVTYMKI